MMLQTISRKYEFCTDKNRGEDTQHRSAGQSVKVTLASRSNRLCTQSASMKNFDGALRRVVLRAQASATCTALGSSRDKMM